MAKRLSVFTGADCEQQLERLRVMISVQYSLFWDEEKKHYELRDGEDVIGILPDDTTFAVHTMQAYNAKLELARLKCSLVRIRAELDSALK